MVKTFKKGGKMSNPRKKFEIEIGKIGVWFTEIDSQGNRITDNCMYLNAEDNINILTAQLQVFFNF